MPTATPTPVDLPDLSAGAIAGIVIGGIVFLLLLWWCTFICRLWSVYRLDENERRAAPDVALRNNTDSHPRQHTTEPRPHP